MSLAADQNRAVRAAITYYIRNVHGNPPDSSVAMQYEHALLVDAEIRLLDERDKMGDADKQAEYPKLLIAPRGYSFTAKSADDEAKARELGYSYPAPPLTQPAPVVVDPNAPADPNAAPAVSVLHELGLQNTDPGRSGFVNVPVGVAADAPAPAKSSKPSKPVVTTDKSDKS